MSAPSAPTSGPAEHGHAAAAPGFGVGARGSISKFASSLGSPARPSGTISRVELGHLVPREWLRAAIAHALRVEVVDLWPPPRQLELLGAVAEVGR